MKKRMLLLLAALLLVFSCSFAEETRPSELLDLWDYGAESPVWVSSAVPVTEGIAMISTASLPENTDQLVVSDGVNFWEVHAVIPDRDGRLATVCFDEDETKPCRYTAWPFLFPRDNLQVSDCIVRDADEWGSRINRGVLGAEEVVRNGEPCCLLTLTGPVSPGSPVLGTDGRLLGIITAEWAEGVNRYLAALPETLAVSLTDAAMLLDGVPGWGEAPEGLTVTLRKNLAIIDWSEMTLPEKAEGESLYLLLVDSGNGYFNYVPAETNIRTVSYLLTPGRLYFAGIVASAGAPDSVPAEYKCFSVPRVKPLTDYGFRPLVTAIAEEQEKGKAPVPVTEVTEELLRSGRAFFYSSSTYRVTEKVEGKSLLVSLTDPQNMNYRYESSWLYGPEYMENDTWYISLEDTGLFSFLEDSGYPKGVYRMAYYVDGDLADSFEFELK